MWRVQLLNGTYYETALHPIISAGVAKQRNNYRAQASVIHTLLGTLRNAGKMNEANASVAGGFVPHCENLMQASKHPRSEVGDRRVDAILPMPKKAINITKYVVYIQYGCAMDDI